MILLFSLMGYEGLEVINPEGSTEDAAEEAKKGRWKQEVLRFINFRSLFVCIRHINNVRHPNSISQWYFNL